MKQIILAVATCMTMTLVAVAQEIEYTGVRIFDPTVRSLQVAPESNPYLPPVIIMGSDDRINVSFDILDYDVHYLRYSVYHCDAQWHPSQLVESEWVGGFNQADITDYAQSQATFTHYFNYRFSIPNEDMQLLLSGNYLLRVYEQDDPDKILLQTRFSVCENRVGVQASVTSRTDYDYNGEHQQVDITLNYKPGTIMDPYGEVTTIVTQNTRTDNEVTLRAPMSVGVGTITYDHLPQLIFRAGNEYRRFETVFQHSLNMGVSAIEYFEPYYHATLYRDEPRFDKEYLYDQTQHGRFTIRNAEEDDSRTESDYMVTHFTLDTGGPLSGGNIFLEGEFAHGYPAQQVLMQYDQSLGCYACDILLKQGAYNYQYLWVPDGTNIGHTDVIDGDKYQTINNYYIRVYDRPSGERYDRLVGFGITRSGT